jgi:hypothetical protein
LIGSLNALSDILHCLRTNLLPKRISFPQFGNMSLKFSATQVLSISTVVPTMQGNTVVVDTPSSVD